MGSRAWTSDDDGLQPLRNALRADVEAIAIALLGEPNKAASTPRTLRWGSKGSLAVEISGAKKGIWFSHEGTSGGDVFALIRHALGCSFPDAVAWAKKWTGVDEDAAFDSAERPRQEAPEPDPEKEQAEADEAASRIARARSIAAGGIPVEGTPGEYYLKQVRGIPEPAAGWPASILWHPGYRAVLAVATLDDGAVQAVQRIHLADDGHKIGPDEMARRKLPAVKVTNGVSADAVVRLPGDPLGPLLIAEGPETGLAVYASTGHETWIALGSVSKVTPPVGRFVVIVSDDNPPAFDAKFGQAAKALTRALATWRTVGISVSVATPWAVRRRDRSDMADVILAHGPEAVRARIAAALAPVGQRRVRLPVAAARTATAAAVCAFFEAARPPARGMMA